MVSADASLRVTSCHFVSLRARLEFIPHLMRGRNDGKENFSTFYEAINFDAFVKSRHSGENHARGRQAIVQMVCPPRYSGRSIFQRSHSMFNCAGTVHAQLISKPVPAVWIISIFRCWFHHIAVYQAVYPVDYGAFRHP